MIPQYIVQGSFLRTIGSYFETLAKKQGDSLFYKTIKQLIQKSMFKNSKFPRLSFRNLPEINHEFDSLIQHDLDRGTRLLIPTIKTHNLGRIKTQDVKVFRRASLSREKLPIIDMRLDIQKENQAVRNICFGLNEKLLCSNEQLTERNIFRVKKVRNTSTSSQGKKTFYNSQENSLENQKQQIKKELYVIDLQRNNFDSKRRSQTKNYKPCRIANTRKLPFQLQQKNKKHLNISEDFQEANISSIMKISEQNNLVTEQSIKELFKLF